MNDVTALPTVECRECGYSHQDLADDVVWTEPDLCQPCHAGMQPIDPPTLDKHYGIPFAFLGEDGDTLMAHGHVTARQLWAAARHAARSDGWDVGGWEPTDVVANLRHVWGVFSAGNSEDFGWFVNWHQHNADTPSAHPLTICQG